jgi:hypothetical protein
MIEIRKVECGFVDFHQYRYRLPPPDEDKWSEWKFVETVTPDEAGVKVRWAE